jgi:hypothetical protein
MNTRSHEGCPYRSNLQQAVQLLSYARQGHVHLYTEASGENLSIRPHIGGQCNNRHADNVVSMGPFSPGSFTVALPGTTAALPGGLSAGMSLQERTAGMSLAGAPIADHADHANQAARTMILQSKEHV